MKYCGKVGLLIGLLFLLIGAHQAGAASYALTFEGSAIGVGTGSFSATDDNNDGILDVISGSIFVKGETLSLVSAANTASGYTHLEYAFSVTGGGVGIDFNNFLYSSSSALLDSYGLFFRDDNTTLNIFFSDGSYAVFYMNDVNGSYWDATFINEAVTFDARATSVPEPATMLLLGLGLLGIVPLRKKMK